MAHYIVISCLFFSHVLIFYIFCSPIFIWKNVATGSISSASMPLKNASWSTGKIKLRYFVYLVSDIIIHREGMADKGERKNLQSDFMQSTESCEKSCIKICTCASEALPYN